MQAIRNVLAKLQDIISITCFVFMSIFVLTGVVMRFVLQIPFPWGEEISRYLMVIAVMIGISMGVREKAHLGVTMFVEALPKKIGTAMKMAATLIGVAIYALLAVLAYQFIASNYQYGQRSPALSLPMYILYGVLLLGFLLASAESILSCYDDFIVRKPDQPDEGKEELLL